MKMRVWTVVVVLAISAGSVSTIGAAETDVVPFTSPGGISDATRDTETYGSAANSWSGSDRMRGNIFSVAAPTDLTTIEQYLNVPASTTLHFSIYRKTNDGTVTGLYTRDFALDVPTTAAGATFYSSGTMSYLLETTYYYYICVGWDATVSVTYYRGTEAVPFATGFGTLETGVPDGGAGNPDTYNNTWTGFSPYYQRLTFTVVPVELQSFTVE
jgi:hypothetical protein